MRSDAVPRPNRSLAGYQLLLPLWEFACRRALVRFGRRLADGPRVNADTLRGILRRNAASEIGRRHNFDVLARSPDVTAAYARALPVADYSAFRTDFERIANGAGCTTTMTFDVGAAKTAGMSLVK